MTTIYPVIMAGGTGTRLWPISRSAHPKQFQRLFGEETMLEATIDRIGESDDELTIEQPLVICGASHGEVVRSILLSRNLTGATVLEEPMGRNTAAVAVAASLYVNSRDPDGIVLLLPADQHVTEPAAFRDALAAAAPLAQKGFLTTMGIKPVRPETGYGYIRFGEPMGGMGFEVDAFVEKPDAATAKTYLDDGGYAWNAGIFVFRADTLLNEANQHAADIVQQTTAAFDASTVVSPKCWRFDPDLFADVRSESIDYAIMEQTKKAAIVGPVDMGWNDVGSWLSVRDLSEDTTSTDESVIAIDCDRSLIRTDGPLVAAIGLEDFVVVATNDTVLIAPANRSQDVKKVVEQLRAAGREDLL